VANTEDLKGQLEITNALNAALERQISLQNKLVSGMSRQHSMMKDICAAGQKSCGQLDKQKKGQRDLTKELENTKEAQKDLMTAMGQGGSAALKGTQGIKKAFGGLKNFLFSWKGMVVGLFGGLIAGVGKIFSGLTGIVKGVFSAITSIVKVGMGVIKGLIMAPFKLIGSFNNIANELRRISVVINGARQSVNGMIGDHKSLGSVTSEAYKKARQAVSTLPGGVFGPREQGAAERIKLAGELVKAFGPYQSSLAKLSNAGAKFAIQMKKNLGFTDEQFQQITKTSKAFGSDLNQDFKEITLGIQSVSKEAGLNIKTMSQDFMIFHGKLKPLTNMTNKQLLTMTATFGRLGISGDKAMSMFDKFETLEGGAEVVTRMQRSLGISLSQTDMIMSRGDPLKQMKLVQEAMKRSGRAFEDLSYDGKKMITEMFGGDSNAAMSAFSRAGMETTDSIEKAAKAAQKAKDARDVPKLLQKLNKSIEGVADSFGKIMKPFEAFMKGMTYGLGGTKISKGMMEISRIFEKMGKAFGTMLGDRKVFDKLIDSSVAFAEKLKNIMPLVGDLIDAMFFDSKESVFSVLSKLGGEILGSYGAFYNGIIPMLIKGVGLVVPMFIKAFAFVTNAFNEMLLSVMDPNSPSLGKRLKEMSSGIFDSMELDTPGMASAAQEAGKRIGDSFENEFESKKMRKIFDKKKGKFITKSMSLGAAFGENILEGLRRVGNALAKFFGEVFKRGMAYLWQEYKFWIIGYLSLRVFGPSLVKAFMTSGAASGFLSMMKAGGLALVGAAKSGLAALGATGAGASAGAAFGVSGGVAAGAALGGSVLAAGAGGYMAGKALDNHFKLSTRIADYFSGLGWRSREELKAEEKKNADYFSARRARLEKMKFETDAEKQFDEIVKMTSSVTTPEQIKLLQKRVELDQQMTIREREHIQTLVEKRAAEIESQRITAEGANKAEAAIGGKSGAKALLKAAGITSGIGTRRTDSGGFQLASVDENESSQLAILESAASQIALSLQTQQQASEAMQKSNADFQSGKKTLDEHRAFAASYATTYDTANDLIKSAAETAGITSKEQQAAFVNMVKVSQDALEKRGDYNVFKKDPKTGKVIGRQTVDPMAAAAASNVLMNLRNASERVDPTTMAAINAALKLSAAPSSREALSAVAELRLSEAKLKELQLEKFIPQIKKVESTLKQTQVVRGQTSDNVQAAAATASKGGKSGPGGIKVPEGPASLDPKKLKVQGQKAGKKASIRVQKLKAAERLSRLPTTVLRLLASKSKTKMMLDGGLQMTTVLQNMMPAADGVTKSLNTAAIPALQNTATAARTATAALGTTVIMLDHVRDRMNQIQIIYAKIATAVAKVRRDGSYMLKGKHKVAIGAEGTNKFTLNVNVTMDSKELAIAARKTSIVADLPVGTP